MLFILAIILLIVGFFTYRKARPPAPVDELPVDTPATPMDPVATGKAPDSESSNRMSTETPRTGTTFASTGATATAVATATAAEGGAPPPPPAAEATESSRLKITSPSKM